MNYLTLNLIKKLVFEQELNAWKEKWKSYLNERTINQETGKTFYTHKRLRSLLKRNIWLFVFEVLAKITNTLMD